MRGGLMVCGTTSDSGKSTVVTALCRILARQGVLVAPFKAQNMALNSAVTAQGEEIGRAQAAQAAAAGVPAEVTMNPILLKPTSDRTSQVVVMGRPWATLDARQYHESKPRLWEIVQDALFDLRSRFDVVICEGAGSPAEINLLSGDIVNLRVAAASGLRAILVGDIDRGGVFAALFGTVELLPKEWSDLIGGFVINKFRGDPKLLRGGPEALMQRTGVATLGVIPWAEGLGIDAEDSLALPGYGQDNVFRGAETIDIAAIRFPRISNFTDLDALSVEPDVRVRLVDTPASVGRPDLLILPGSKSTVSDLAWLRQTGLAEAVADLSRPESKSTVLGICGGYQMLGSRIVDAVESPHDVTVEGLGLLPVETLFHPEKLTQVVTGTALGTIVHGYEIHHGRTSGPGAWMHLGEGEEGSSTAGMEVLGTSVHGLFEGDDFRDRLLSMVATRSGKTWAGSQTSFAAARESRFDRLADLVESSLDMGAVFHLIEAAGNHETTNHGRRIPAR